MADDRAPEPDEAADTADENVYEPPTVEPLGSADELAKGNEGSQTDGTTTQA